MCAKLCLDNSDSSSSYINNKASNNFTIEKREQELITVKGKRVLELGAGCGIVGMCASLLGAAEVLCTDCVPRVLDNLAFNLCHNANIIENHKNNNNTIKKKTLNGKNSAIIPGGNDINLISRHSLKSGKLDWAYFAADDLHELEWIEEDYNTDSLLKEGGNHHQPSEEVLNFTPDVILGSDLIYSPEGGLFCADCILHWLQSNITAECWVMQIDRPGFDIFLRRLKSYSSFLTIEIHQLSKACYDIASEMVGNNISSTREDFNICKIRSTQIN
mmetsp:Transcript_18085/g.25551  ORF Transcript_18085/g.25551 Transcript_18085/m.25551 type:complete len:274 (+) Transcript_18085:419-1240(+)